MIFQLFSKSYFVQQKIFPLCPDSHFAQEQFYNCFVQVRIPTLRNSYNSHFAQDNSRIVLIPILRRTHICNYLANTTYSTHFRHKNTTQDLCLGRGRIQLFFRQCSTVFYLVLYSVRCGAVHVVTYSHFINRFMMSEGSDSLSLPFTSKPGQLCSVAQNRPFFFFYFTRI